MVDVYKRQVPVWNHSFLEIVLSIYTKICELCNFLVTRKGTLLIFHLFFSSQAAVVEVTLRAGAVSLSLIHILFRLEFSGL